jgi:1-aminocyclopropane-1-carboxylate deaminase/D-cysteine desulfhydrase-like pyridoxal-dependent ACC family enzyme
MNSRKPANNAKASSDTLTVMKFEAMQLAKSINSKADAYQTKASLTMYDSLYYQARTAITQPVAEFHTLMDQHTLDTVYTGKTMPWLSDSY